MFIKSIVLDGFKSYGTRTEIKGFDPEFNAITGLNGTGKSNILDSICFVLGISNLSHVRAGTLQDLIYKSGQAGVTKASVTIVFDNSDGSKCPINYEKCSEITVTRQIAVAGKNKYLINGSIVSNKFVNDFFSSIQLNVNNPHFLIMQGRITKVLNMKPPEILSMIEEAAGTRMYENKKQSAQKTIEKKDARLKEMDEMVSEQINPKLQRLKDERSQYMEFQKVQRELEHLTRIYIAWQYLQTEGACNDKQSQIKTVIAETQETQKKIVECQAKMKETESQIEEAQAKRDEESGGRLQAAEAKLKEAERIEAKAGATLQSTKEAIGAEERKRKECERSTLEDEKALAAKKAELSKAQEEFEALRQAEKTDSEALANAQSKYQAVSSGLLSASNDGAEASLQDQLIDAKQQLTRAETEIKQCSMQRDHSSRDLKSKEPQLKKTALAFEKDKVELESCEKQVTSLEEELKAMNYEDGLLERLQEELRQATQEMRQSSEKVNSITRKYPHLAFHYKDPEPNFNRNGVKGLLCKLFTVKDERFARALEAAAGGKLYNVVVENEHISSKLIQKGQLLKRTTFAPLNQIQGYPLSKTVVQKAKQLVGDENARLALSLIDYEPRYEKVMAWVFGQILVCTDSDTAAKVCYHPEIMRKTITLDGDVFDPHGVISGGAVEHADPILSVVKEVKEADEAFVAKESQVQKINAQINQISSYASKFNGIKLKLETKKRELEMVRMRVHQTSHYQLQKEIDTLKETIDKMTSRITELKEEVKKLAKKVSELEGKMKNLAAVRENELKTAEANLKKCKKKAEDSRNNWKKREQEFETLNLEIEELEKCVINGREQLLTSQETITQLKEEVVTLTEEHAKRIAEVKEVKGEVKLQKEIIGQKNKEIQQLVSEKDKLVKALAEYELSSLSGEHSLTKLKADLKEANTMLHDLKKKYKWIENDREYFGNPNGMYDFAVTDPQEAGVKMKKLLETKEKLGRNVNAKAMDALAAQEEQFQEVMNKKGIIEGDRSKILSVIEELDVKKQEVIRKAWEKVDQDFNSILSSLLPSAHAKLKPVDGKDFLDGLEVKVGFGGIWKDSLDELSGGQRSLVALSLILAMLLFKPAPLYILDEVDAALDPSHTQNIGQMLKAHFKQSQFLIVSLKDGMFNNANVLFRTSFVDGMSAVTRTTNNR